MLKINFRKPNHWDDAYIHFWSLDKSTTWPGVKMDQLTNDNYAFYSDTQDISFVLNEGSSRYQTEDFQCLNNECWSDGVELWETDPELDSGLIFPEGKSKAIILSYDDGTVQDERLIKLFNRYNLKGTFHLNSGLMNDPYRIPAHRIREVYQGHEVSCHSSTHPNLQQATMEGLVKEIYNDQRELESIVGYKPQGLSYPFGSYNLKLIEAMRQWDLLYGRVVPSSKKFSIPGDLRRWRASCHHSEALRLSDSFFKQNINSVLFFIWGHSWELDSNIKNDNWKYIEELCERLSGNQDVWYTTAIEFAKILRKHRIKKGNLR